MMGRGYIRSVFRKRNSNTDGHMASLNSLTSTASLKEEDAAGASGHHYRLSSEYGITRQTEVEDQEPVEEVREQTLGKCTTSPLALPNVPSTPSSLENEPDAATAAATTRANDINIQQQQRLEADLDERLSRWQGMLENESLTPMERANLFFATGRLLVHLGRYQEALQYYEQELQVTRAMLKRTTKNGNNALSDDGAPAGVILVARIHLAIGRVAKNGLHDLTIALQHYEKGLKIQTAMYRAAVQQSAKCSKCCNSAQLNQQAQVAQKQRGSNSTRRGSRRRCARVGVSSSSGIGGSSSSSSSSSFCTKDNIISSCDMHHRDKVKEAAAAVEDTRRRIGRIHFEQGNVDLAVLQLVQQYPCTSNNKNNRSSGQTKQQTQATGVMSQLKNLMTTEQPCRSSSVASPATMKDLSNDETLFEI
jgi:tetratricopeptide (TPR) repeat protein